MYLSESFTHTLGECTNGTPGSILVVGLATQVDQGMGGQFCAQRPLSAHEYHLHLICIVLTRMHVISLCFVLCHDPASRYQASDRFAEQKTVVFESIKRLTRTIDTSASQILLEEVDLIAYR